MEQEKGITRMVCDSCYFQFDTNHPEMWDLNREIGETQLCPKCQRSRNVHPME